MANTGTKRVPVSELGVPLRKRTEKACDQCRRRKTKCDGAAACKACVEIGLDCSYGQRIKQARGPQYVAHLETRLKELESKEPNEDFKLSWQPITSSRMHTPPTPESSRSSKSLDLRPNRVEEFTTLPGPNYFGEDLSVESNDKTFSQGPSSRPLQGRRSSHPTAILSDARLVLDVLGRTNYNAKCAAQCLESLHRDLYPNATQSRSLPDFTLFGNDSTYMSDLNTNVAPFEPNQMMTETYIDPSQTFGDLDMSSMDFFGAAPAS